MKPIERDLSVLLPTYVLSDFIITPIVMRLVLQKAESIELCSTEVPLRVFTRLVVF